MMEKVATINRELTTTEVVQFFNKSQSHKHEHRHCIKPKGGEVFLFYFDDDICKGTYIQLIYCM
jgi:hypothetical protein